MRRSIGGSPSTSMLSLQQGGCAVVPLFRFQLVCHVRRSSPLLGQKVTHKKLTNSTHKMRTYVLGHPSDILSQPQCLSTTAPIFLSRGIVISDQERKAAHFQRKPTLNHSSLSIPRPQFCIQPCTDITRAINSSSTFRNHRNS